MNAITGPPEEIVIRIRQITLGEAVKHWEEHIREAAQSDRTARDYIGQIRAWLARSHVRNIPTPDITVKHLNNWINTADGTKLSTRKGRLAAARSLFKFCCNRRYAFFNPALEASVKARLLTHEQKEPATREPFTDDELKRVLGYLSSEMDKPRTRVRPEKLDRLRFWYFAVLIGRDTGLRLGDICSLEWSCFASPEYICVWTDKSDTRVQIPVDQKLRELIGTLPRQNRRLCFPKKDALSRSIHRSNLSVQFGRILKASGVIGKSFHCLRHKFLSELVTSGSTLEQARVLAGHASAKTTEGYVHTNHQPDEG